MYGYPTDNGAESYERAVQRPSYIRVFQASPNTPAVDVYVNETFVAQNLGYGQFSQYVAVLPGNYNIAIYPAGEKVKPILSTTVYIPENTVFNLAIIGVLPDISIYTIPEPFTAQNFGRACIRLVNLSPESNGINVTMENGSKLFSNIGYEDITNYACIPSGTYTFTVSSSGTNNTLATVSNVQLAANNYYTIYVLSDPSQKTSLQTVLVSEPR